MVCMCICKVCMCICNGETFCCGFVGLSTGTDWEVVFQGVWFGGTLLCVCWLEHWHRLGGCFSRRVIWWDIAVCSLAWALAQIGRLFFKACDLVGHCCGFVGLSTGTNWEAIFQGMWFRKAWLSHGVFEMSRHARAGVRAWPAHIGRRLYEACVTLLLAWALAQIGRLFFKACDFVRRGLLMPFLSWEDMRVWVRVCTRACACVGLSL